jgi:hypothetical protein
MMTKLERIWFAIRDLRLARQEIKNSDFLYKVVTIKATILLVFLSIKITAEETPT